MNILFCDFGSYIYRDLLYFFGERQIHCKTFFYHFVDKYEDDFYRQRLANELECNNYDFVFSVNFHPLIAIVCYEKRKKYLSWSYDSPLEEGLEDYFWYETNYIFLFDRIETETYRRKGFTQVFHMPLAVNMGRLCSYLKSGVINKENEEKFRADISFVGQIYQSPLDALLFGAEDYVRGYVESVFQAQLRIYGSSFVETAINDDILQRINGRYKKNGQNDLRLNKRGLAYAIESKITQVERSFLLTELGEICSVNLYDSKQNNLSGKVNQKGPVGYFDKMPLVFHYSKINLNMTLKSIRSGIPLRALDIMACGGLLFSNYQLELAEAFEDGKELIMYNSIEDAIEKAIFYLQNEECLQLIAERGMQKVREAYTYPERLNKMLQIAGII